MDKKFVIMGAAAVALAGTAFALTPRAGNTVSEKIEEKPVAAPAKNQNVLIGDVGGTNVRL